MTVFCHPALLNRNNPVQMEMFSAVELWVNNHPDKNTMLDGLSREGVRAGRHHDQGRKAPTGGDGGHSHGGHSHGDGFGGYVAQAQQYIPGSHGGGGGSGIGGYIHQAQQMFSSGGGGNSGLGELMQSFTGQMMGKREIGEGDQESYEAKDSTAPASGDGFKYPAERYEEEVRQHQQGEFKRPGDEYEENQRQPGPSYPRTPPPPPQNYPPQQHQGRPPPQGYPPQQQGYGQPPYPDGQLPYPRQGPYPPQHYGQPPYGGQPPYPYDDPYRRY